MVCVVAKFLLKDGMYDKALEVVTPLVEETRKEAGCVQYDFAKSNAEKNVVVMLEAWESQNALDVHSQTEHFTKYVPQLSALCQGAPVVETFEQVL